MEKNRRIRFISGFLGLLTALLVLIIWNINAGSVHIPVRELLKILFMHTGENWFSQ